MHSIRLPTKPLLLAITTLALTLNALGLELVKCGSVKIPEGFPTNYLKDFSTAKARPDGTTLFDVTGMFIVVKPFVGNTGFIPKSQPNQEFHSTNDWSYLVENGVATVSFNRVVTSTNVISDFNVIFNTFGERGFLDSRVVSERRVVENVKIINGVESRVVVENSEKRNDYICKVDLSGNILARVSLVGEGFLPRANIHFQSWPYSYNTNRRILVPKLNGDTIDFYLVTDPDLFPDTALGAPRVEGGSATFNVTTGSEEPLEIQASDDLKIWKRLKTLEDANGRSVTVPADAAQGFLRAVER